jgi:hypothetical protein
MAIKLTLLNLVQDMLVAIDAEDVTSVGQTPEAGMCVNIANRAFEQVAVFRRWRHFKQYSRLEAGTNLNELTMPSGTIAFQPNDLWYNDQPMQYMRPEMFQTFTIRRNTSESNIQETNDIKIYNDRDPDFFTSADDETLVFDAIPSTISGLDASLSRALIYKLPTSRLSSDSSQFDLPAVMFPALDTLCISLALGELKGDSQEAGKYERRYKVQMSSLSRNSRLVDREDDRRRWIVPRTSQTRRLSPLIWTGEGFIQ